MLHRVLFFQTIFVQVGGKETTITFIAAGDIMLGRYIGKVMAKRGNENPFEEDYVRGTAGVGLFAF